MRGGRLRTGEVLTGLGAVALLALLPLRWVGQAPDRGPGVIVAALLVAVAVLGLALVAATVAERSPALPVTLAVATVTLGLLAVLVLAVRLLVAGAVRPAALGGLAATLLVAAGAWRALGDERTDAPYARAQTERLLRAAGPPRDVDAVPSAPDPSRRAS